LGTGRRRDVRGRFAMGFTLTKAGSRRRPRVFATEWLNRIQNILIDMMAIISMVFISLLEAFSYMLREDSVQVL